MNGFKFLFGFVVVFFLPNKTMGQGYLSVSTPFMFGRVIAPNNFSPPTAINRKAQFTGRTTTSGLNITYTFQPRLLKSKNLLFEAGLGYQNQKFNIIRPFNYASEIYILYYARRYYYQCFQGIVGLTYNYRIGNKYFATSNLSYNWVNTFRQVYNVADGEPNEVQHSSYGFERMVNFSLGVRRQIYKQIYAGLNGILPLYLQWRNDRIFKDDPAKWYGPQSSIGYSVSVTYKLK